MGRQERVSGGYVGADCAGNRGLHLCFGAGGEAEGRSLVCDGLEL